MQSKKKRPWLKLRRIHLSHSQIQRGKSWRKRLPIIGVIFTNSIRTSRFFKDRHWLFTEFPELKGSSVGSEFNIFEVGCGVGNTVFPILQINTNPHLLVHCCDFASSAIQILKGHSAYDPLRCHAFQFDVTSADSLPIKESSLDLVILIFVLSAIHPQHYSFVIGRLAKLLRPGGTLLFRDYGQYDMAQLRFKKGQHFKSETVSGCIYSSRSLLG